MNINRIRALLKYSTTVTNRYTDQLPRTSTRIFKTSNECPSAFVRIYCSYTNSLSNKTKLSLSQEDYNESSRYVPSNYTNIDYDTITGNNPKKILKLKLIQEEICDFVREGKHVPTIIKTKSWKKLLNTELKDHRLEIIRKLWVSELYKEKRQDQNKLNIEKRVLIEIKRNAPLEYGLQCITLFHRIYSRQINHLYNWKLLQSNIYGQKMIVDCSYEDFMNDREITLCARQLLMMWGENRDKLDPFNMIYCNLNPEGQLFAEVEKLFPSISDTGTPFNWTKWNFTDLFPKNELVYLTPHSNDTMEKFDPDCIYIIGAFVDTTGRVPVSLAKAKRYGLRTAKFPLDKYLNWKKGKKLLMLHECLNIMSNLKDGKDWDFALKNILKAYIEEEEVASEQLEKRDLRYTVQDIQDAFISNRLCKILHHTKK